jgi:predicted RNA-binding protein YlxR (DUF448 family)
LTKKRSTSPVKHIPQRSCVACGQVRPKRELVRLVRLPGGGVEVDPSGRKAGRGAYLCPATDCWQAGLGKRRLDYVLRTRLSEENRERLMSLAGSWDKE